MFSVTKDRLVTEMTVIVLPIYPSRRVQEALRVTSVFFRGWTMTRPYDIGSIKIIKEHWLNIHLTRIRHSLERTVDEIVVSLSNYLLSNFR